MAEVLPPEHQSYFSPQSLRRTSPTPNFLQSSSTPFNSEFAQRLQSPQQGDEDAASGPLSLSAPASASIPQSHIDMHDNVSVISSSSASFSIDANESSDDEINLPSYCDDSSSEQSEDLDRPASPNDSAYVTDEKTDGISTPTHTPEHALLSSDDTAVREQPVRQVDYLSHEWREQDIWSSWRYIVSQRKYYGERSRLENASWRTWAKQKYRLKTVTPETLNWLKDCDVTWLYGPLQTSSRLQSETVSRLSKSNSFLHKKPILKKRSMSEVMLQKSLSTSSLIKQAAAAVKAQEHVQGGARIRGRPVLNSRAASDFVTSRTGSQANSRGMSSSSTSGLQTPADGERKHIRFDEKVEQCIAVDAKDEDEDAEDDDLPSIAEEDDDSSDDGVIMMKTEHKRSLSRSDSRSSFSGESKIIAKLPSTRLKYRTDSPDVAPPPSHSINTNFWRSSKLSPSASQETLRPTNPATNFLLHDESDTDEDSISWEPSGAFSNRIDSLEQLDRQNARADFTTASEPASGMRRTESGMFMPFEDDDEAATNAGIIGRVMDGVNTARDIAHVIWNVGWRGSQ